MNQPRLLYISVNDGTDTRVAKEIATLSQAFEVTFVGVRQEDNGPNSLPVVVRQLIIPGRRRGALTLVRLAREVYRLRPAGFDSIHVVNENLLFALFPLLLAGRNVVLDVFDSIFLKNSPLVRSLRWPLQWFAHSLADTVLVTDEDRRGLVPASLRGNVSTLPNYPDDPGAMPPLREVGAGDPLRIFFSGSLSRGRGTNFLASVLATDNAVEVVAAGWIYDDDAREICSNPRVRYLGVITAAEAAKVARGCDYILCLYSPDVPNNIHASPNKIYDAMLVGVPVIINAEVKAANFVRTRKIGFVLPSYYQFTTSAVMRELRSRRGEFRKKLAEPSPYTWSAIEHVLLESHLA